MSEFFRKTVIVAAVAFVLLIIISFTFSCEIEVTPTFEPTATATVERN